MLPKYASTLRYAMLCCATLYLSRPPIRTLLEHDTVEHTKVGGCVPDMIGYSLAPDVCIIRMRTSVTCGMYYSYEYRRYVWLYVLLIAPVRPPAASPTLAFVRSLLYYSYAY